MIAISAVVARKRTIAFSYVLDLLGVTAEAAYSVRKLLSAYSGQCIRVRRDSDNAEQDIGFDATTHILDTTALLSFVGGGSGYITTWYDQTGNSRNLLQTGAGQQPVIVSSGTVQLSGGRPAPYFTVDYLTSSSWGTLNQPFVRNYVFHNDSTPSYGWLFTSAGAAPNVADYIETGTEIIQLYAGASEVPVTTIGSTENTVWTNTYNGASSVGRKNGTAGSTGNPGSDATNGIQIGSYGSSLYHCQGWYSELMLFATTLTLPQEQLLERNQGAFYSITVA